MSIESCSECGKNVEQCHCLLEPAVSPSVVLHRKPPLGVMPHFLWLEKRIAHIQEAIDRYDEAGMFPKPEWIEQRESLLAITTLYETNRRLNRRCQALESIQQNTCVERLVHTNRRLNRRCQDAESALQDLRNELEWKLDRLFMESNRAWRYAGELRDIYRNHRAKFKCYGCWWCKLKWRVNRWLWKMWSME